LFLKWSSNRAASTHRGLPILCASEQDVPTPLQLPLQQKHVADNPFAVIPVIGVWSAISVVAGGPQSVKSETPLTFVVEVV
jgi:hypothetical protein